MSEQNERIAVLENSFEYIKESFSNLEKKFDGMSEKIDDLKIEWQKFGGLYNSVESINRRVNELENWKIQEAEPAIQIINEGRSRFWDGLWSAAGKVILLVIGAAIVVSLVITGVVKLQ